MTVGWGFSVVATTGVVTASVAVVSSTGVVVACSTSPGTSDVFGAGSLLVGSTRTGGVLPSVVISGLVVDASEGIISADVVGCSEVGAGVSLVEAGVVPSVVLDVSAGGVTDDGSSPCSLSGPPAVVSGLGASEPGVVRISLGVTGGVVTGASVVVTAPVVTSGLTEDSSVVDVPSVAACVVVAPGSVVAPAVAVVDSSAGREGVYPGGKGVVDGASSSRPASGALVAVVIYGVSVVVCSVADGSCVVTASGVAPVDVVVTSEVTPSVAVGPVPASVAVTPSAVVPVTPSVVVGPDAASVVEPTVAALVVSFSVVGEVVDGSSVACAVDLSASDGVVTSAPVVADGVVTLSLTSGGAVVATPGVLASGVETASVDTAGVVDEASSGVCAVVVSAVVTVSGFSVSETSGVVTSSRVVAGTVVASPVVADDVVTSVDGVTDVVVAGSSVTVDEGVPSGVEGGVAVPSVPAAVGVVGGVEGFVSSSVPCSVVGDVSGAPEVAG